MKYVVALLFSVLANEALAQGMIQCGGQPTLEDYAAGVTPCTFSRVLPHTFDVVVTKSRRFIWKPQPDITTFELARTLHILFNEPYLNSGDAYDKMPPEVQRHWEEVK